MNMISVIKQCDTLLSCDDNPARYAESLSGLRRLTKLWVLPSGTRAQVIPWVQNAVESCKDSVVCVEDAVVILATLLVPSERLTLSCQVHARISQVVRLHGSSLEALNNGGLEVVRRCLRFWATNSPLQAWAPCIYDHPGACMDTALFVADLVTRLPCLSPVLAEGCWLPCAVDGLRVISSLLVSDEIRAAMMPVGQRILCLVAGHSRDIELVIECLKVVRELALNVEGHAALHSVVDLIRDALGFWAAVSSAHSDGCVLAAMACLRTLATSGTLRAQMMDLVTLGCIVMDLKVHSIRIVDECISWLWNLAHTLPDTMRNLPDRVLLAAVPSVMAKYMYYSESLCIVIAAMGFLTAMTTCEGNRPALAGKAVSLAALQAVTDFGKLSRGRIDMLEMQVAAVSHLESMHDSGCLVSQFRSEDAVLKLVDHVASYSGRAIQEEAGPVPFMYMAVPEPYLYMRSVGLSLSVLRELVPLMDDMDAVAVSAQLVAQDIAQFLVVDPHNALLDPALELSTVLMKQQVRHAVAAIVSSFTFKHAYACVWLAAGVTEGAMVRPAQCVVCCCGLEHPAPYNSVISKMNPVSGSSWCGGAGHGWGFLQVICGQQCPRCSLRSASNIPYRLRTMMCLDSVVKAQQMRAACVRGSGGSDCTGCPHAWHCPFGVFAQIVRCRRSPLRDERQLCHFRSPDPLHPHLTKVEAGKRGRRRAVRGPWGRVWRPRSWGC